MKNILRTLAALGVAILTTGGAAAADLDSYKDTPRQPSYTVTQVTTAPNWQGLYIGVHGGGGAGIAEVSRWLRHDLDLFYDYRDEFETYRLATDQGRQKIDLGLEGLFGGVDIEYKFQRGAFIFAPFADISISNFEGSTSYARNIVLHGEDEDYAILGESGRSELQQNWFGTAGLKLGFLVTQNTFVYALGGVSWAEFDLSGGSDFALLDGTQLPFPSSRYGATDTVFGWTVGAGVETRLGERTTLAVEGRYYDYDSLSASFAGSNKIDFDDEGRYGVITGTSERVSADPSIWTIRAALKWQIN